MRPANVQLLIDGLKEGGINFIASLPSSSFADVVQAVSKDEDFLHVPVAHENDAVACCFGAWLAGRKPALLVQNSGMLMGTYSLLCTNAFFGGVPILLVIEHKGDFYDESGFWFYYYGLKLPPLLESLDIPYSIVREGDRLKYEVTRGAITASASGKAAAVLVSGEEVLN